MHSQSRMIAVLALLLGALALSACAGSKVRTPEGYPTLYVSPENENLMVFTRPGLDFRPYRKVFLERTRVQSPGLTGKALADDDAVALSEYVDAKLHERLSHSFQILDAPAKDALRIRFTIVDADATSKAQMVMMMPPFALVNMVSPKGAFFGSVTIGGEFFEGMDNEPSAAFVGYGSRPGIDVTVAFRKWDVAKKVIDNTTEKLARDLDALRATE